MFRLMHKSGESGFTIVEVTMAVLLFAASVVGVAGMMIQGGMNINRGAADSTAANLASEKIEEVKALNFYEAYSSVAGDRDIDDFYFRAGIANGVAGQTDQHPQLDTAWTEGEYGLEDYGSIQGFSKFKRTTAIEFQYVSASGNSFIPAVMADNWVPEATDGSGTDEPRGGDAAGQDNVLHAAIIEVCVYYQGDTGEQVYKQRGIAGDLLVTGGNNDPVIAVTGVAPTSGYTTNNNLEMTVNVDAVGDLGPDSSLQVTLWYARRADIVATNVSANVAGNQITCHFDLTPTDIVPGMYNIAVYWIDEGFEDKNFRECFKVKPPDPTISAVSEYSWGYNKLNSRQVTFTGTNLQNPKTVQIIDPVDGTIKLSGSDFAWTTAGDELTADFNMTEVPNDSNYWGTSHKWDVYVETFADNTSAGDSLVLMNPPPAVSSMSIVSGNLDSTYSNVDISGTYFQSLDSLPVVRLVKASSLGSITSDTVYVQLSGGTFSEGYTSTTIDDMTLNLGTGNFKKWGDDSVVTGEQGTYYLYVKNADGQEVLGNSPNFGINAATPSPTITSVTVTNTLNSNTTVYYNDWDTTYITINGNNFNTDPTRMDVILYKDSISVPNDYYSTTGNATGGSTSITGVYLNTIGLAAGTGYDIKIIDQATGKDATKADCITITEPMTGTATSGVYTPGEGPEILPPGTVVPSTPWINDDLCTHTAVWPQANAFWNNSPETGSDIDTLASKNVFRDQTNVDFQIIAKRLRHIASTPKFRYHSYDTKYYLFGWQYTWHIVECTTDSMVEDRDDRYVMLKCHKYPTPDDPCPQDATDPVYAELSNNGSTWPGYIKQRLRLHGTD